MQRPYQKLAFRKTQELEVDCGCLGLDMATKSAVDWTIMNAPRACGSTNCAPDSSEMVYKATKVKHFAACFVTDESCFTIIPESHASRMKVAITAIVDKSQPTKKFRSRKLGSNTTNMTKMVKISPILMVVMLTTKGRPSVALKAFSANKVARTLNMIQPNNATNPTSGTSDVRDTEPPSFMAVKVVQETAMRNITCHCTEEYLLFKIAAESKAVRGNLACPSNLMKAPSK
eukprot:TRINITY_DN6902_c1_g3_i3.p2 TRINITY_DN6902_c1_g3~~TRINITY_DN6902_c1_g3_i3.p2  ORF type:complete len:231 (-),score=23.33 TRINITY_DN6902_c1_g3_i3:252-944(-)